MNRRHWLWLIIVVLLAGSLACSGGRTSTPVPTTAEIETVAPETPAPPTQVPEPTRTPKPKTTEEATQPSTAASLEIFNESGMELAEVFISGINDSSWGANWLSESIPAGSSWTIQGIDEGTYDLKAAYSDGSTAEVIYNVALSGESSWSVYGMEDLPENAVLRFEEGFEDNRNSWGEDFGDEVDYNAPAEGQYCIDIKVSDMTAWEWYEPFRTDSFIAEVKCSVSTDTDASCGLGFGPDGDNLFWYELDAASQSYAVFLLQDDAWQDALIEWTQDLHINPSGTNFLALGRSGGTLYVYANGALVNWVDTDLFPTGRIGIGGATYDDAPVSVCLDDLMVWRIE